MSLDPWRGYDAWRTSTPWDDEVECPESCASMRSCPNDCPGCTCDGNNECKHCMDHLPDDCDCPTDEEIACERADYLRDAREDR